MNLLQKFFHMTNKMKIHQLNVALKVILCWPTIATQKSFKLIDRKLWIYPNGFEQIIFFLLLLSSSSYSSSSSLPSSWCFFVFCIWVMIFLLKICSADDEARTIVKHTTAYAFVCTFDELIHSIGFASVWVLRSVHMCIELWFSIADFTETNRKWLYILIF